MHTNMFSKSCSLILLVSLPFYFSTPAAVWAEDRLEKTHQLEELVTLAWAASGRGDYAELDRLARQGADRFEKEAMAQQAELTGFPTRDRVSQYKTMNDLATLLFIRAESLMHQGKTKEAVAQFESIIKRFPYAQQWDPSRGAYWSIAEKSQASIDVMTGVAEQREEAIRNMPKTIPELVRPGKDKVVDYTKYGQLIGVGTENYKFQMGNPATLAEAVGEGIYPNTGDVLKNPRYKELYIQGRLNGNHWDYVLTKDLEAAYFKWATAPEDPGVKLFYTALVLERAGHYLQAIKAYHALVVNFPRSVGLTYWQTPWYPAQAAVSKINFILRIHPELGLTYKNAKVRVINGSDNDTTNDTFVVWPGELVPADRNAIARKIRALKQLKSLGRPQKVRGGEKTKLVQYQNGHWRMFVDGKPFVIKGITYAPTKIGQSPDKGTLENWMFQDHNKDGRIDSPYEAWVDKNANNVQDAGENNVGDFQIMKDMGANAIRIYHNNNKINHELLRELYEKYGIMAIVGDFVGKYTLGSGADWATGTDYENAEHRRNMMKSVEQMVNEFKDEPYVLLWVLGNENNYGVASNADKKPEAYFRFINDVAKRIKELDPTRPVAVCNGDVLFLDIFGKESPDVDIYAANIYRGDYGFGSFWDQVRMGADRPAFITEYGAPAYSKQITLEEAEEEQALYHKGNWMDIEANLAGHEEGEGNALGGIVFEWLDEWWKNYEPSRHDTKADVIGPFSGGYYYEEWFGIVSQGDGSQSPLMRQLRKAYYSYKKMWTK